MNTDRNLLFGVLAMQMDLIDAARFAEGCAAWSIRKHLPLSDILVEREWITAADRADVERFLERKLKLHGGDVRRTLEATTDAGVANAAMKIDDEDLRRTIVDLSAKTGHVLVDALARPSETKSRYTLSRLHGQGGLGRVWVARDNDLNREVALKELQTDRAANTDSQTRFLREAQITGQLEHPNIVPVYELGRRSADGQPFYTMRLLRGRTLRHAIHDYHKRRGAGTADSLELRRLLGAFVGICHALAYAHTRGVIHRDVKPSNVALGDFGEVVLLDWGLAKIAHAEEPETQTLGVGESAWSDPTMAGRALGTPSYMAPEQAEGRLDQIGPRTDIYGLGASLFELLVGHPPHKGENTEATLDKIIKGQTPRARAADPTVPAALDAICAKAMAKSPDDRFAKASDVADDINRWLDDEPVSVYRDPPLERAARWARRHRTWTRAAAAALVAISLVASGATILVNHARTAEAAAKTTAQNALVAETAAKQEATRHFKQARNTVDTFLVEIGETLRLYPGMEDARVRVLQSAADEYERLAATRSDNVELRSEFARAAIRLGDVRGLLDKWDEALRAHRTAESLFDSIASSASGDSTVALDRANCRTKIGNALKELGRFAESEQSLRAALAELEVLVRERPKSAECLDALATCCVNLSVLEHDTGDRERAVETLSAAIREFASLAKSQPAEPRYRFALGRARITLGHMLSDRGDTRDAAAVLRDAVAAFESLGAADPNHPDYAEGRATAFVTLAGVLRLHGQVADATSAYESALGEYGALMKVLPDIPHYREFDAVTRTDVAEMVHELGLNPTAKLQLEPALATFRALADERPGRPQFREEIVWAETTLGRVLADLGQNDEAAATLRSAVETMTILAQNYANFGYAERLAVARSNLGRVLSKLELLDEAETELTAAIHEFERLIRSDPSKRPRYRNELAWSFSYLGDLRLATGRQPEAREAYMQAKQLRTDLAADHAVPEYLFNLAWFLSTCPDGEVCDATAALAAATSAKNAAPENSSYWNIVALAHYRAGTWADCLAALDKAEQLRPDGHGLTWLLRALTHVQLSEFDAAIKQLARARDWLETNAAGNGEWNRLLAEAAKAVGKTE